MRESTPIFDQGDAGAGRPEGEYEAASCCTEIGCEDRDDLSLPVWEVIRTALLAIVVVGATALIATLAQG
jgi:hypothetical protein